MLTFEQAVERAMIELGQLMISPDDLMLDDDKLEKLFVNVARKLQNKRPVRAILTTNIDNSGTKIKDAMGVLALKYKLYQDFDRGTPPIDRKHWTFDPVTKIIKTLYGAPFVVIYLKQYTIGNFEQDEITTSTVDGEDETDFYIKASPKPSTLVIKKNGVTMKVTDKDSETLTLSGDLGTGTLTIKTNKITLELADTTSGDIEVSYVNKRKAVKELEEYDLAFQMWFNVDFLKSIGALKAQGNLDPATTNVPFSLTNDMLLERARFLEDQLQEQIGKMSSWQYWGY